MFPVHSEISYRTAVKLSETEQNLSENVHEQRFSRKTFRFFRYPVDASILVVPLTEGGDSKTFLRINLCDLSREAGIIQ